MVVYLKGNTLRLSANISEEDFKRLAHLHQMGEIHVSLSVSYGERVGWVSFDDIQIDEEDPQMQLIF